ncbi:MAG: IS4 family transposase [Sedimentisphaeraceae bacterium JB056]
MLKPLHEIAIDPLRPNKRTLHMDEYIAMFLMYMFSPMCDSLRSIQRSSELKDVCKKFGFKRTGLSTLSEAQHTFDSALLEPIIDKLFSEVRSLSQQPVYKYSSDILLVDGTVIPAVKEMLWAVYGSKGDNKALKCHFLYNLNNNVPMFTKVTNANVSEKKVLAELLEKGKCYVMDRGYAKHTLMQAIIDIQSSFVVRIRDNSIFEVIEERELSRKALNSGIVRDTVVKLGKTGDLASPVRIVEIACKPHKQGVKLGRGGPRQGETILIVTNELDLPATMIGAIYKSRWEIEIFFRYFKHLLGCNHLLCRTENGVRLEMNIAIIACMLIMLWTERKPTKATLEMLQYYMLGLAADEDLENHIKRLKTIEKNKSKKS